MDNEDEDDFTQRLNEVEKGQRLRRRSTLVSDFGFKKKQIQKFEPTKLTAVNENTANNILKDTENPKNWIKGEANKRKLCIKRVRGEAFFFMNQLGKKLRNNV